MWLKGGALCLSGEYQHNIDQKGRVFMPAKFREELGDKFVVTKGLDKCLFVYPYEEWKNFEQKLRTLPLTSKEAGHSSASSLPVLPNVKQTRQKGINPGRP